MWTKQIGQVDFKSYISAWVVTYTPAHCFNKTDRSSLTPLLMLGYWRSVFFFFLVNWINILKDLSGSHHRITKTLLGHAQLVRVQKTSYYRGRRSKNNKIILHMSSKLGKVLLLVTHALRMCIHRLKPINIITSSPDFSLKILYTNLCVIECV